MTMGMSIRSDAICLSRAFSSARSGEPGRYDRLASLTGAGTRGTPAKDGSAGLVIRGSYWATPNAQLPTPNARVPRRHTPALPMLVHERFGVDSAQALRSPRAIV